MFKASMQTDLEHQKAAMKRDCDAVKAECDKLRTGAARGRGERHAVTCLCGHSTDTALGRSRRAQVRD